MNLLRRYPFTASIIFTGIAYSLVIGTLYFDVLDAIYPSLSLQTVNLLSHVIACINTITVIFLFAGWRLIRRGDVKKHPIYMSTAFVLIIVFLILYLIKTGGGGRKEFSGPFLMKMLYLLILGTHILLSIVSVPLVVYTLLLGCTRPVDKIYETSHSNVGQYAAGAWIVSLILGLIAYLLLNHIYSFTFQPA